MKIGKLKKAGGFFYNKLERFGIKDTDELVNMSEEKLRTYRGAGAVMLEFRRILIMLKEEGCPGEKCSSVSSLCDCIMDGITDAYASRGLWKVIALRVLPMWYVKNRMDDLKECGMKLEGF